MEKIQKIHINSNIIPKIKNNLPFLEYQKNSQIKYIIKILHRNQNQNKNKYNNIIKLNKIKTPSSSNFKLNSSVNENNSILNNLNYKIYQNNLNRNNNHNLIKLRINNKKISNEKSFNKKINFSSISIDFNNKNNEYNNNNKKNQNSLQFLNKILLNNDKIKLNYNNKIYLPKLNIKNSNNKDKIPFENKFLRNAFDKNL